MFWSFLVVVTVAASCSAIFTVFEGLGYGASILSVGTALVCVVVAIIAVKTSLYDQCYLVICCILSCFLMPLLFLFCGGLTSGMPIYCMAAIALISFATPGKFKTTAFITSLCIQVTVFAASWFTPELVLTQLDRDTSYVDYMVANVVVALTLFCTGSLTIWSYTKEREKTQALSTKIEILAMRDSLTGLYNRQYLLKYLEKAVWHHRSDYFVAMLDLDNFKRINRDLGHDFGDEVICTVAKLLQNNEQEMAGECVARYGCERFVYVINANSEVEAYARVEQFRKAVRLITFEKYPQVSLTISGGLVPCNSRNIVDVKQLLDTVDTLLIEAKKQGKNQIRNMVE